MNGISTINIELTSRCNKDCFMCGRRESEKSDPDYSKKQGDMEWRVFLQIIKDLEPGMIVQLHWNGEPTLYHNMGAAIRTARKKGCIVSLNTNAMLMVERWRDLAQLHSVSCSIIQNEYLDTTHERQFNQIHRFLQLTDELSERPLVTIRALGTIPEVFRDLVVRYPNRVLWAPRIIHAPELSRSYTNDTTVPELGICLDLLTHLAIDRHGDVYPCARYNPDKLNRLGNIDDEYSLAEIARRTVRKSIIDKHLAGKRDDVALCRRCSYWGCPTAK